MLSAAIGNSLHRILCKKKVYKKKVYGIGGSELRPGSFPGWPVGANHNLLTIQGLPWWQSG